MARRLHRGRLFRRYFLLILALVCGTLVISGGVGLYFAYQENKVALASLQREKAGAAAARIEQFVRQIEQQLAFAALPQLGAGGVEQRRIEFLKLLKLVPAVTDIAYIDAQGREQLSVSRLSMDVAGSRRDRSREPAFREAKPGQSWFGDVHFRKDTEPYIAMAIRSGEAGPVTVADVNLKFIWDVITRIRIGEKGKAYVVDRTGHLVADPDIGLVLRKTDLSGLEHVKAALAPGADDSLALLARDLGGREVLAAHAPIDPLGWKVFAEQPVSEVFASLDATILRTVLLLVAGLLLSALAALWLARSMVRPISTLQQGAARIGAGDLEQKIEVKTGDELESLADEFNQMSARLRESYAGLERKVEARTAELRQSLDFQQATGEILTSISGSIADTQPVFDAIVQSMRRLFGTRSALVALVHDGQFHLKAVGASDAEYNKRMRAAYPRSFDERDSIGARALRSGKVQQLCPVIGNPEAPASTMELARQNGFDSMLVAPMIREGKPLGIIATSRAEPIPFDEKQVALIKAFADQAVIAIENVRLFNETKEALEQQTATAEILKVIASSPSDEQPVFEAIIAHAGKIAGGSSVNVTRLIDDKLHLAAYTRVSPEADEALRSIYPVAATTVGPLAEAIRRKSPFFVGDFEADPNVSPKAREVMRARGFRSTLYVPIVRGSVVYGVMHVSKVAPGPFPDHWVTMLQVFADQAVIAIENVRLFNETKDALERQTATSDILKVISSSTTDVQPVFEAIVQSGLKLFPGATVTVTLPRDGQVTLAAVAGLDPAHAQAWRTRFPFPLAREYMHGLAIIERRLIDVPDATANTDPSIVPGVANFLRGGHRAITVMPMLRGDAAIGAISVTRVAPGPLSEKQIALLRTFADQAVIAIENVRLFNETKEALEQQTATAEVLNVISGSITDANPVFDAISRSVLKLYGPGHVARIYVRVGDKIDRVGYAVSDKGVDDRSQSLWPIPLDDKSLTGRAILGEDLVHIKDTETEPGLSERSREIIRDTGVRSVLIAPMRSMGKTTGALSVGRRAAGGFTDREVELIRTFADQAVIAMENVRLFREIQDKSRELEIANKHKSDFLANMSHELRTPLNAIIGFSEVLIDRMFGEVNEKQADYLKDIHESGKHLLSLINDILDLSKIEAGRMDLEISAFDLPGALSNAMTLVRERAQRHGIALGLEVDPQLGALWADERKFKQIVLNLLSNAVKFTPDGGRVDVSAAKADGKVEIAVKDTGIGIAPEDQAAVFEEFKQVGRDARRKAEGTGLGLALTKRFVELHGGEIRLQSEPGKGSIFTITLPVRQ